ncbi:3,4-dihydroxy-2-butanone-4-phosphate synthase [Saccharopolyspora hirsuta]|uniref:3,4-dihydroxy-2-butanone-4-phosphate synthase n=1 Tax=Saccharopolyspora hirsuta TaxID=1837 RepID=UPI00331A8E7A
MNDQRESTALLGGAVDRAAAELAAGRAVVVHGCSDGGGIVFAAARADVELTAFAVRHSSGFLCVALSGERCDELVLPPMSPKVERQGATACVTVDASAGVSTGISASDRARTARLLAAPHAEPADFTRPGHVVPVAIAGHRGDSLAEVAFDLVGLAGLTPAAVYAHLVSPADPTRMATTDELTAFAVGERLAAVPASAVTARRSARWDGPVAG